MQKLEGAAASAKVLFLVNPNGVTRSQTLAQAPNGAVREGLASDVSTLQVNKGADFNIAMQAMERIEARLNDAFLMAKSVQRQAERVTSTEIQIMASELEQALGGIYSILSNEFQLPYIKRRIHMLVRSKKLKKLEEEHSYLDKKVKQLNKDRLKDRSTESKDILSRLKRTKLAVKDAIARAKATLTN